MVARLFAAKCCLIFLLAPVIGWSGATFAMVAASSQAPNKESVSRPVDIEVFVREGCPNCARAEAFLEALKQEQPELRIAIRDVRLEPAALERLRFIAENRGAATVRVPRICGGRAIDRRLFR